MVGVIEREIRSQTEGPQLAPTKRRTVGFADILNERDTGPLQFIQELLRQSVISEYVSEKTALVRGVILPPLAQYPFPGCVD